MASESKKISRRDFLNRSTRTAAGVFAASALASCAKPQITYAPGSRVHGASERINMAIIGVRGRGSGLAKNFAKIPNVRVKTLCDIDERLYAKLAKQVAANQGFTPETEYDLRRVFEDKEIDAIATATPNHWHAFEGRKMIEATRKYNRIVCVGFQNRSSRNVLQAMKFIHDGGLGEIYMVKGLCYKPRDGWKVVPNSPVPAGVHYDLWLGPADYQRFNENRFHYRWHWFWNTGNGDIGNQGVHQMDVARWGINKNEHPV
ncbi:MAG: Gfo/Idh/MocA family oxidoreductase, partial [Planctomycetota bacterium]